ncbi:FAD-dependent monooxygenase [Paramyrothecium foliicola]|nr:FAD-dependent monooxygenase [Paramyrothecium foliicola]
MIFCLSPMETFRDDYPFSGRHGVRPLAFIIVGAGICGLATGLALAQTGHAVTILETSPSISEMGAGLQIAPNATRILGRLGVLPEVMGCTSVLSRVSIRRWDSDEELGTTTLMPDLGHRYGAPMGVIHRGELQRILLKAARDSGCHVLTSQSVLAVDATFRPHAWTLDRRTGVVNMLTADVIVAADGIRSTIRRQMAAADGDPARSVPTGDAAYRLLIPRKKIKYNKELLQMLDQDVAVRYMGPGAHIMAYPLNQKSVYNMVLVHPASSLASAKRVDAWVNYANRDSMMEQFGSWSPLIRSWLAHADIQVVEWPLHTLMPLRRWVRGSVALAGDACHPMLPYVAQGAANGLEDAAVLAAAFTCTADISLALGVYEVVRKDRAERIIASAAATGRALHLPDGPEQQERDCRIGDAIEGKENGDEWRAVQWQDFVWGADVMRATIENWDELAGQVKSTKSS